MFKRFILKLFCKGPAHDTKRLRLVATSFEKGELWECKCNRCGAKFEKWIKPKVYLD